LPDRQRLAAENVVVVRLGRFALAFVRVFGRIGERR
jgi:hypothetical protein